MHIPVKKIIVTVLFLSIVAGQSCLLCGCNKQEKASGYNMPPPVFNIEVKKKAATEEIQIVEELDCSYFNSLCEINPDIVGWLIIPDTKINYPVVQTTDNEKYLHTGFDGTESVAGTIFLDYESDSSLMGKNNIIYGHNMRNGTMFHDLNLFKDKDFFKSHPYLYIYTKDNVLKLKIVSCFYGKADVAMRQTRFDSQEEFTEFVDKLIKECPYAEVPQTPVKSLYTFITCSYEVDDGRTYLLAVEE